MAHKQKGIKRDSHRKASKADTLPVNLRTHLDIGEKRNGRGGQRDRSPFAAHGLATPVVDMNHPNDRQNGKSAKENKTLSIAVRRDMGEDLEREPPHLRVPRHGDYPPGFGASGDSSSPPTDVTFRVETPAIAKIQANGMITAGI